MPQPSRLRDYFYQDPDGLRSLHAQTVERVETAVKKVSGGSVAGKGSGKVGFKQGLLSLLGMPEAELSTEVSGSGNFSYEVSSELALEHLITRLESALADPQIARVFPKVAAAANSDFSIPTFVSGVDYFEAPQFVSHEAMRRIQDSGYLILQQNVGSGSYNPRDDYFKSPFRVTMAAGLNKCTRLRGSFGITSHEALYFRAHAGRLVPIGVFGKVEKLPGVFQIKPYALWR